MKILRQRAGRPAEANPPGLGRGDALCLALAEVSPLVLRHEGEDLQDDVAEEGAHQVLAPPGVQQGHVQHHDIHPLLLGKQTPLVQNLPVVAPQAVDAVEIEQIVPPELPHQALVLGAVKVLPRLLVGEDVPRRDIQLVHG